MSIYATPTAHPSMCILLVACPTKCKGDKCEINTADDVTCSDCIDFWYATSNKKECKGRLILIFPGYISISLCSVFSSIKVLSIL